MLMSRWLVPRSRRGQLSESRATTFDEFIPPRRLGRWGSFTF
jgi:hypothetical protein